MTADDVGDQVDQARMVRNLIREWETTLRYANTRLQHDLEVASIFFGGGTPSLMRPGDIEQIVRRVATSLRFFTFVLANFSII